MPKKKGPDPAAILAELQEVKALTRDFYLKAYRREQVKSAGHRNAVKEKVKTPGFEPQPPVEMSTKELDRLIARKNRRTAWDDDTDDPMHFAINDDLDGTYLQLHLRSSQRTVKESLYHIMSNVDGVDARQELDATDGDIAKMEDAVDQDPEVAPSRDIGQPSLPIQSRCHEVVDMAETLRALWSLKKVCLAEELSQHLKIPVGRLHLLTGAVVCRYLGGNPARSYTELLVLFLWTTDPLQVDRLLGLWQGSQPPADYTPVSPNISQVVCGAIERRDLKVLGDWINYICVLAASCQQLPPDKTGRTLYCGVKDPTPDVVSLLKAAKADDIQYWPCLASASMDLDTFASEEYKAVFIIRGTRFGIDLTQCTTNPAQAEIVLPPFSLLRVKSRVDPRKLELEHVGNIVMDVLGDIPLTQRTGWKILVQDIREAGRATSLEGSLVQRYQIANRQVLRYKDTLHQLSQFIQQAEAENEVQAVPERTRGGMGGTKNSTQVKEDPAQTLEANKATLLDQHTQWAWKEQGRLERELRVLK
eukprot:gene3071-4823_t